MSIYELKLIQFLFGVSHLENDRLKSFWIK